MTRHSLLLLAFTLTAACTPAALDGDGDGRPDNTGEGEGEGEVVPVSSGGACSCDVECEGSTSNPGVCVYGVCFQEASTACSADGSTAECDAGSRCWPLVAGGPGLCWPDCDAHTCAGTCDEDGSCAPSAGAACDDTCAVSCVADPGDPGDITFELGDPPPAPTADCSNIPSFECTVAGGTLDEIEAFCGELIAFDPRQGDGYDDYPGNGETANDQYRSFSRRDVVMLVKYATAHTRCIAQDWDFGDSQLGLGDMSEANGNIPGTRDNDPGHPEGSHLRGYDMDIGYYQLGAPDNHLREICPHTEAGAEAYHCTGDPTSLDVWREVVFISKLMDSPQYLTVGVDGRVGPILRAAAEVMCGKGIISGKACGPDGFSAQPRSFGAGLSFDVSEADNIGWFQFHHHHQHLSIIDKKGEILPNW